MKKKVVGMILMAAILVLGTINVFALDYHVPENTISVTARFFVQGANADGTMFTMTSEDGETVITITEDTIIYFEDFVPLSDDEDDGMTQMVREVLFGRTLAEVLEGRNLRVILEVDDIERHIEPVSIMVLFETAVHLPAIAPVDLVVVPLEAIEYALLNGELVVNDEILENAPIPFWQETDNGNVVMVPLRVAAEALGYDVSWNDTLQSIQLGIAIHIWIGNTEAHLGRMAPLELSAAPMLVDDSTFVPLDFFRSVLGQTAYVFEGQVVIGGYDDMM